MTSPNGQVGGFRGDRLVAVDRIILTNAHHVTEAPLRQRGGAGRGKSCSLQPSPSIAQHRDGDIQSLFRGVAMTVPRYSLDLSHATVDGDFAACHEAGIIG